MPDLPYRLSRATFHGPLSPARADRLVARVAAIAPRTVLDIGCGWGEMLLRILAATPDATGIGIDLDAADLARARRAAKERRLKTRVEFAEETGHGTRRGPADVVLCLGATHAVTDTGPAGALAALRTLVNPGGRVLVGDGFWQRPPTDAELSRMWPGATADDHVDLAGLAQLAVDAGFRVGWLETANTDEWEEFESAYQADAEEWLATHSGHPRAAEVRERLETHRQAWLKGYRNLLGMAYLTLIPQVEWPGVGSGLPTVG